MFLDASDFLNTPYKIPNIDESRSFADDYIEAEETKILKQILGLRLYNEFIEGLNTSGDIEDKWLVLRYGATSEDEGIAALAIYTIGNADYEYCGLVDFLKPYICSKWPEVNFRKPTTSGIVINNGQQNTQTVTPDYEVVTFWNEFSGKVGGKCRKMNTLYGFLQDNLSDYEDLVFTEQKVKNQHDF